jgi:hypothetical protein
MLAKDFSKIGSESGFDFALLEDSQIRRKH